MCNGARLDPEAREFLPCGSRNDENGHTVSENSRGKCHTRSKGSRRSRTRNEKHMGVDWKTLRARQGNERETIAADKDEDHMAEKPICILCCDPMSVISFGACEHRSSCEKCCLRLRMCYSNLDCPICKKELKEIVLAPWRGGKPIPPFSAYQSDTSLSSHVTSQLGPGVVLVDKWHENKGTSRLLNQLLDMVSVSCPKCSEQDISNVKFKTNKSLIDHLRKKHQNSQMCSICLEEKRVFARDQQVFPSPSALQRHKKMSHPTCQFCNRKPFYDSDALWYHLIQEHFRCQLCDQQGNNDAWYRNAPELQLHLANEHFACEHENCRACLVAFLSLDDLQRHHLDHHTGRMRRWDQSQSRPLQVDYSFRRRSSNNTSNNSANNRLLHSRNYERETRGGLEVIDDDVGMLPREAPLMASESTRDHFPSLAEGAPSSSSSKSTKREAPKLVSHQVKCPCGRRKTNHVVPEGQPVPSLTCDGICRLEGRKNQLDDAFGIDRTSHISVFNKRKVTWSGILLRAAKDDVQRIREFEILLEDFLRSRSARRQLGPSPKSHRAILHGMAEQYGIPTVSLGNDPNRAVQLFKPTGNAPAAGIPDRLLSEVCTTVSDEEIANLIKAAQGHHLRFIDISKTVDLDYFLRSYCDPDGYRVEWDGDDTATVIFKHEDALTNAKQGLQGGIRGLFRIDPSYTSLQL